MQDEEIDNMDELIREASENHHPVYDDKAWEKMEALLDKHLPLRKERKGRIIFFLFLFFIAGAVFFAMLYHSGQKKGIIPAERQAVHIPLRSMPANSQPGDPDRLAKSPKAGKDIATTFLQGTGEKHTDRNFNKAPSARRFTSKGWNTKTQVPAVTSDHTDEKNGAIKSKKDLPEVEEQVTGDNNDSMSFSSKSGLRVQEVSKNIHIVKSDSTAVVVTKATITPAVPEQVSGKPPAKSATKKGFSNNFAVNLSAGPDVGFVGLGDASRTRLNYGAGLSYTFGNRVTLRSGFYIANKVYTAKPSDYHPPYGYWTYNADLKRVNADCSVYEIPLSASYSFKQSKNHSWLAGIGFSSFFMKRETYNYLYKDAWGRTMNKIWTLRNGSNHYFSVLTISGGYQYRINNYFSILAEPYLKLPLHGIGFGKIKLNGGGLLFTASIQPFAKRK